MISVIMVSRNDDYGLNLPLRTVHSLNNWADQLQLEDEILFVDDASPEGREPLPVAVKDHLSYRAKKLLKILVVTQETHDSFGVTCPVAENHGRNIGIRRAAYDSEWIISTTNDNMVSGIYPAILDLGPAIYVSMPREVDGKIWTTYGHHTELLNRVMMFEQLDFHPIADPKRRWLIHGKGGDCLIAPKSLLLDPLVRGFEEAMKGFGHGESNLLRKSIAAAYKTSSTLVAGIRVFHLAHSTQESPVNFLTGTPLNDFEEWCVQKWETTNGEDWGMWPVEEVRL